MSVVSRVVLKTYFNTGDKPTEAQFANLIDSLAHVDEAGMMIGQTETDAITGSIYFASSNLVNEDNTKLFWDNTNKRLIVGANSGSAKITGKTSGNLSTDRGIEILNNSGESLFRVNGDSSIDVCRDEDSGFYPIYFRRDSTNYYNSSTQFTGLVAGWDGTSYFQVTGRDSLYLRAGSDGSGNESELLFTSGASNRFAKFQNCDEGLQQSAASFGAGVVFKSFISGNDYILDLGSASMPNRNIVRMNIGADTGTVTVGTNNFAMYASDIVAGNAAPHFKTENGNIIKIYQETVAVAAAVHAAVGGAGLQVNDTIDGYTILQVVKALRNQGLLA